MKLHAKVLSINELRVGDTCEGCFYSVLVRTSALIGIIHLFDIIKFARTCLCLFFGYKGVIYCSNSSYILRILINFAYILLFVGFDCIEI